MDIGLALGGVGLIGFLVALGQLWKQLSIESKWIPLFNMVVSLAIVLPVQYSRGASTVEEWVTAIVVAVTLALAASGLYSGQKSLRE